MTTRYRHPGLQALYEDGLTPYYEREPPDCLSIMDFPVMARDSLGRPVAAALFMQRPRQGGPRVAFGGTLGAIDQDGFCLAPDNVVSPGTHELLDVCLRVETALRAAWHHQQAYQCVVEVVAHHSYRALLRRPTYLYPLPPDGWLAGEDLREAEWLEDEEEDASTCTGV